jgi:hypothetical protein
MGASPEFAHRGELHFEWRYSGVTGFRGNQLRLCQLATGFTASSFAATASGHFEFFDKQSKSVPI